MKSQKKYEVLSSSKKQENKFKGVNYHKTSNFSLFEHHIFQHLLDEKSIKTPDQKNFLSKTVLQPKEKEKKKDEFNRSISALKEQIELLKTDIESKIELESYTNQPNEDYPNGVSPEKAEPFSENRTSDQPTIRIIPEEPQNIVKHERSNTFANVFLEKNIPNRLLRQNIECHLKKMKEQILIN